MRFPISVAMAACVLVAGASSAFAQGATYKVVAFTGQSAPGGGTFYHFQNPVIGADGSFGFVGIDDRGEGSFMAVYGGAPGALRKVAGENDPVPGQSGAIFESFGAVSVAKDGKVGFNADVYSEGYGVGIFTESSESVTNHLGKFSLEAFGNLAFRSGSVFAKALIGRSTGEEIVTSATGALLQAKGGIFDAALEDGADLRGRYLQKIYQDTESSSAIGTSVDVSETGKVAMKVGLRPGPSPTPNPHLAIVAGDPSNPEIVAEEGNPAPGLSESTFADFSTDPSIAADGHIAFSAQLNGDGPSSAIFSGLPGALGLIAQKGSRVPTTVNVEFGTMSGAVVNSTGDVVFRATIWYPNETTREGFWVKRLSGEPVLLAISGMSLPTPGGPRVVESVDFAGPGTFNDLHQFVFRATFDNGDQGIYVADTRPGAPVIFVRTPRKPREFVTTQDSVEVAGLAIDETGVEKVEFTVAREVLADRHGTKAAKKKPKKFVVSRVRLAKGDVKWSFKVPLSKGLNLISIVSTDKLGNVSEPYKIRMLRYDPDAK